MNQKLFLKISSLIFSIVLFSRCGISSDLSNKGSQAGVSSRSNKTALGKPCRSDDPDHMCLAVKVAVYNDTRGNPTVSQDNVARDIDSINKVWNQCKLGFQVDQYAAVEPRSAGLSFNPANNDELTDIRKKLEDSDTLLVVFTGTWDRSGTLGNTAANAWTSMPGEFPLGAVLEKPVGTFANIIGHELGHYLSLPHVYNESDLMNPIIYDNSTYLSQDQCSAARSTAQSYWQRMLR